MKIPDLPSPLRGIVTPIVTPLLDDDQLDLDGFACLLDHLIDGGVAGIFALGTTGEGPSLSYRVRHETVERVCDHVAGRVPVLIGITDTAVGESLRLAEASFSAGASAVVAALPYYLGMSQLELAEYFEHLADKCPLPLFLYNMPSCTKVVFEAATAVRLASHGNIVGIKDSSGDLDYVRDIVKGVSNQRDFTVLVGPEELLVDAMSIGAHGGVNGGSNMFPSLYARLHQAAIAGDAQAVSELHENVMAISSTIYAVGQGASRHIRGIKCVLRCLGFCHDHVAWPFRPLDEGQREQIRRHLDQLARHSSIGVTFLDRTKQSVDTRS